MVVKEIPRNLNLSEQEKQKEEAKYFNEIDNLASIHRKYTPEESKNIVKVFPFQIASERHFYIVMEYCHHATLLDLMKQRKLRNKKFNLAELLAVTEDLVNGYGLLHSNKIIHHDLKPHNIFIKDSVFKIGDFGTSVRLS